jgi:hypothetical protein
MTQDAGTTGMKYGHDVWTLEWAAEIWKVEQERSSMGWPSRGREESTTRGISY